MCMADSCDFEGTHLGTAKHVARKDHRCGDCGRIIGKGESYMVGSWASEGRIERMKMCAHCRVVADWLEANCGGYVWGGLIEDLREHIEEYAGVYPPVVLDLKRIDVMADHDWRFKRGPRAGQLLPVPKMPRFPANPREKP
jgi:hypothetical protein